MRQGGTRAPHALRGTAGLRGSAIGVARAASPRAQRALDPRAGPRAGSAATDHAAARSSSGTAALHLECERALGLRRFAGTAGHGFHAQEDVALDDAAPAARDAEGSTACRHVLDGKLSDDRLPRARSAGRARALGDRSSCRLTLVGTRACREQKNPAEHETDDSSRPHGLASPTGSSQLVIVTSCPVISKWRTVVWSSTSHVTAAYQR